MTAHNKERLAEQFSKADFKFQKNINSRISEQFDLPPISIFQCSVEIYQKNELESVQIFIDAI